MPNNKPAENIMETLERVDGKLEKLLAIQARQKEIDLPEPLILPEEELLEDPVRAPLASDAGLETCGPSAPAQNPLPSRVAISAREMDSIFQKVDKINHDAEILERVGQLERKNRKIIILGSMFMALTVLMLGAFGYLMVQGNLLNKEVFLTAEKKAAFPLSPSGETTGTREGTQLPAPIIAAHEPEAPDTALKASDPQPVATPTDLKAVEAAPPVQYVGYKSSNKYHYPTCKWAAGISHYAHWTFSSVKEAREKGYIPCPTCHPPGSD